MAGQVSFTDGSCKGKIQYDSKVQAKHAIKNMLANGHGSPKAGLSAYKCKLCGFFHVGHSKPWLKPKDEPSVKPSVE